MVMDFKALLAKAQAMRAVNAVIFADDHSLADGTVELSKRQGQAQMAILDELIDVLKDRVGTPEVAATNPS